jgi:hypothetical protein
MSPGTIDWDLDWPWHCGGLYRVTWNATPVVETWTATLTNINVGAKSFTFTVAGSVTGADGGGTNAGSFTSTSGRVVIQHPQDWVLPTSDWWIGNYPTDYFTDGYTVTWDVEARHSDTYTPPGVFPAGREHVTTLAQGLTNEDHTLVLTAHGNGTVPIKAFRVYRPFWGRSATTVPDPLPVRIAAPSTRRAAAVSTRTTLRTFDLRGNRAGAAAARRASGVYVVSQERHGAVLRLRIP